MKDYGGLLIAQLQKPVNGDIYQQEEESMK